MTLGSWIRVAHGKASRGPSLWYAWSNKNFLPVGIYIPLNGVMYVFSHRDKREWFLCHVAECSKAKLSELDMRGFRRAIKDRPTLIIQANLMDKFLQERGYTRSL